MKEKYKIIIKAIYNNIEKAKLTEEELFKFIYKNKLEFNDRIYQLLS